MTRRRVAHVNHIRAHRFSEMPCMTEGFTNELVNNTINPHHKGGLTDEFIKTEIYYNPCGTDNELYINRQRSTT